MIIKWFRVAANLQIISMEGCTMSIRKQKQEARLEELIAGCRENTIDAVITQFGLNRSMLRDKVGGPLPTPRNARNGIFPDEQTQKNYSGLDPHNSIRGNYDDRKRRGLIYEKTNRKMRAGEKVTDAYSDRDLENGKTHIDHVLSLKEASQYEWMHMSPFLLLAFCD